MGFIFEYSSDKKYAIAKQYVGFDKVVSIPEETMGLPVKKVRSLCFFCNDIIEQLYIPDKIELEDASICNCENLKNVYFGDKCKASRFIEDCSNVEIDCNNHRLYKKVSKLYENESDLFFYYDYKFNYVYLPKEDGYRIDNFVFSEVYRDINIPDYYKGKKVLELAPSLFVKSNIISVRFNDYINKIPNNCFLDCVHLENLYNFSNIKIIGDRAFYNNSSLNLDFSKYINIDEIGEMAFSGAGLQSFIPKNPKLKFKADSFAWTDVELVDLSFLDISSIPLGCFYSCKFLKKVILPKTIKSLETLCFSNCSKLKEIENISKVIYFKDNVFSSDNSLFLDIDFLNVKEVGRYAFYGVRLPKEIKLKTVNLNENSFCGIKGTKKVDFIGKKRFLPNECFYKSSIVEVNLNKGLKKIGNKCFAGSKIKRINLENVEDLGGACFISSNIKQVIFKNLKNIGPSCFHNCISLEEVFFDITCDLDYLSDCCFLDCYYIENFKMPKSIILGCDSIRNVPLTSINIY